MKALLLAAIAFLAGNAAAAQTCPDARFPKRLICADADLRATDAAMNAAYAQLRGRLDATTRGRLEAAQTRWLHRRALICDSHRAQGDARKIACLRAMTERRRTAIAARQIDGELIAGPAGAPRIVVDARVLGSRVRSCAVNVQLPRVLGPGAVELNDSIRDLLNNHYFERAGRCAARPPDAVYYEHDIDLRVTWHDARVVALTIEIYHDEGDGRPDVQIAPYVLDVARGRPVGQDELIAPETVLDPLADLCRARIEDRDAIPVSTFDAMRFRYSFVHEASWSPAPDAVTVWFPTHAEHADAAAGRACTLRLEELRPYLRRDNPLWPAAS